MSAQIKGYSTVPNNWGGERIIGGGSHFENLFNNRGCVIIGGVVNFRMTRNKREISMYHIKVISTSSLYISLLLDLFGPIIPIYY